MGTNPTKAADNIYCKCRKEAAKYNDKLNSREGAAELLGISASTLADYELGITKIIPADAILRMADLYNAPELRNHYCKYSCPLGQDVPLVDTESLDRIAVRALASLKKVQESKENLLDVVADGVISEDEKPILQDILSNLDELTAVSQNLKVLENDGTGEEKLFQSGIYNEDIMIKREIFVIAGECECFPFFMYPRNNIKADGREVNANTKKSKCGQEK